ncbi:hypothetical protein FOYG_07760 [Fusarium oxysporum NRRL 32931]|uniref:Uncharacterized protein n=1 Tax=Fusarium oxysporum NRRL 32931 TaxID=660029 RepID=W9IB86_FUSOX|nr:hypothetical protein FOYG_07760 [Fusarium oxysporum NRRL 32931]
MKPDLSILWLAVASVPASGRSFYSEGLESGLSARFEHPQPEHFGLEK